MTQVNEQEKKKGQRGPAQCSASLETARATQPTRAGARFFLLSSSDVAACRRRRSVRPKLKRWGGGANERPGLTVG
jgi:hypothetical protein